MIDSDIDPDYSDGPSCEQCGSTDNVSLVIEPYAHDLYGKEVWVYLCGKCHQQNCEDI